MILPLKQQSGTLPLDVSPSIPSMSRRNLQMRRKLLYAINRQVQSRLEQSLHSAVLTNLQGDRQLDFTQPCDLNVRIRGQRTFLLPSETRLSQLFLETGGTWVILGQAGSGKTTLLLELASDLIVRAQSDFTQPIPVVLDLATWQTSNSFAQGLALQLHAQYQFPIALSQQWLDKGQILPLLDGLDELETEHQQQCLQAIAHFLDSSTQPLNLVVCDRLDAYRSSQTKLYLQGAVSLQPLTPDRIKDYLIQARSRELWHSLESEPHVLAVAKTPLFLSMMALADEEILIHSWKRLSEPEDLDRYLLNAFIRRMLTREIDQRWYAKGKEPRPEVTRHWLTVLAEKMQQANVKEFALENLQPSWLQTSQQWRIYRMSVGIINGIICALVTGVVIGLIAGLHNGFILSLIGGGLGIAAGLTCKPDSIERTTLPRSELWKTLLAFPGSGFIFGLMTGPIFGLILGLGLRFGAIAGGIATLILGVLLAILWLVLRWTIPDIDSKKTANQGIKQAVAIAAIVAPIVGIIAGLVLGVAVGLVSKPTFGIVTGIVGGLVAWFAAALPSLLTSIQHFVLRSILTGQGLIPWNYTRFLNYATSRLLLQRVNGRYRFMHELLREHFAQS